MDETGSPVYFDASESNDPDAVSGNGIETYEWTVLFDKEYDDTSIPPAHSFIMPSSSDGKWAYTFSNVTVDPSGQTESLIRIELVVIDKADKLSERYKMYFSVVPEGFGDEEPTVQIDVNLNGSMYTNDTITLTGNILDGAEQSDVYVEAALDEDSFDASAVSKFTLNKSGEWRKSPPLGNGDSFELTLTLTDLYNNTTFDKTIYLKIYEGEDKRWPITYWIEIRLDACQGDLPSNEVLVADKGAYWIWNADTKECEWSGEYTDSDGDGIPDKAPVDNSAESGGDDNLILYLGGGGALLLIVVLTLFFVLKGGDEDEMMQGVLAGLEGLMLTEQLHKWIQWNNTYSS